MTWAGFSDFGWVGCIEGTGEQRSGVGGDLTQVLRRELSLHTAFQGVLSCLPALRMNENCLSLSKKQCTENACVLMSGEKDRKL